MSELKPCPFCGGKAKFVHIFENPEKCMVSCRECDGGIDAVFANEEAAAEAWNRRTQPANKPLTLEQLREMDGEPVWIQVLDRPDLSRWHFIVRHPEMGLIAKDGLGQYECYPHNSDQMVFSGCYYDIQHGHNYGVNWLAYRRKPEGSTP